MCSVFYFADLQFSISGNIYFTERAVKYMFLSTVLRFAINLCYFALHIGNPGSFPPPLSAKKETELLKQYNNGDKAAGDKLIEHNLRLVAHIVKKYYTVGYDQEDLISIGTVGLIKAVSTFKNDKNIRLATYASRCIENEILMYFRASKKSAQDLYINDAVDIDKDGNSLTLIDIIPDKTDIENEIETKIRIEHLKGIYETALTKREQTIINMRYGINGEAECTQREIAKKLGISRSYVSRIEKSALQKLKNKLGDN